MTAVSGTSIPHTATSTATITVDSTGLAPGSIHTGSITYIAGQVSAASTSVTLSIANAASAGFTVAPQSLSFRFMQGSSSLPAVQNISVFSQPGGVAFTPSASSVENWLTIGDSLSATSLITTTPGSFSVAADVANLSPGTFTGNVRISWGTAGIDVPVTIVVIAAAPPILSVSPTMESFLLAQGSAVASGQVTVSNTGGGTLQFSAEAVASQGTWLTLIRGSGSATPPAPASLDFTADSTGLAPGIYAGEITVQDANSTARAVVDVTLAVSQAAQSLTLSQSGLTSLAIAGGQTPPPQSFTVSSQGSGTLAWTAQPQTVPNPLAPSVNWLSITPASGLSVSGQTGSPVEVSADSIGLPPGQYYGFVNIDAPDAANNPQTVLVLLNVTAASDTTSANVGLSTGGVIFSGLAGSSTVRQQQVTLFNPSNHVIDYSAAVITSNGIAWLSVSPSTGQVLPGSASLSIAADLSVLLPGIQTGTATIAFDNGTVGVMQVEVVAIGPTSGPSARQ